MGVVYRAVDTTLQRPGGAQGPRRLIQLPTRPGIAACCRRRAPASSLNHPHIVTVYEVDEKDGVAFIAMELVQGHAARMCCWPRAR
jgi:serine/threonine-protein kinase